MQITIENIDKILEKLYKIKRYNTDMQKIGETNPTVKLIRINNEWVLDSISFDSWDIITVCENHISLTPSYGTSKILFRYDGWDGLLDL